MEAKTRNSVKKAKKGILSLVFSRKVILVVLVLIQLVVFGMTITYLKDYATYVYAVLLVLSVVTIIYIFNNDSKPDFKISWMLLIMIAPILGTVFYVFMKMQPGVVLIEKGLLDTNKATKAYMLQDKQVLEEFRTSKPANANLATYMANCMSFPTHRNTVVKYFTSGEEKFAEMKEQLRKAESYIFLEYFIIDKGRMWNEILDILKEKVWQGVDVREMYDGTCSIFFLPYHYEKELRRAGIKCKQFSPVHPILSSHQNNRDHRKICVVDGRVAVTGGVNLADEYINEKERFGHWKDTAIMLEGEVSANVESVGEKAG